MSSFSSFFGRARHLVSILDQQHEESAEEADDLTMPSIAKPTRLPLLKDLPLDPSTLCKLACSFVRLRTRYSFTDGGGRLGKTALRLLTSRNGRLLRECPMHDLVRLCDAVATSEMTIAGRERISNFIRRFVHYLNDFSSDESFPLSSQDISSLLWSLGELGVRYHPNDSKEDAATAYRKLQLVTEIPSIPTEHLERFSDDLLSRTVSPLACAYAHSEPLLYFPFASQILTFPLFAAIWCGFDAHRPT